MATVLLVALAALAALVALAAWLRHRALTPVPVGQARIPLRALGEACPALLMAGDGAGAGAQSGGGSGGSSGGAPKRKKPSGPERRDFLKWFFGLSMAGAVGSFGVASLAFLWPNLRGGFGSQIEIGAEDEILASISENEGRFEFPEGRSLIVQYDPSTDSSGQYGELTGGTQIMALYQVCVHLGCKVPWCASSQWWECPCHGSRYNRWGEYQAGPAPRGLDRFATFTNDDGVVVVDTAQIIPGPPRGTGVLDQPPEGPSCV
ncbi:MAG: ubiquinol-cytochrome c reductase iron-sulfur subunit [Egibacteraceae bacterium]